MVVAWFLIKQKLFSLLIHFLVDATHVLFLSIPRMVEVADLEARADIVLVLVTLK